MTGHGWYNKINQVITNYKLFYNSSEAYHNLKNRSPV